MAQLMFSLTQSKYYSPVLNAAIFDGAVRIYFTQFQESAALKIYFRLQEMVKQLGTDLERFRKSSRSLLIVIYPTAETFQLCWGEDAPTDCALAAVDDGDDILVGIPGPLSDESFADLMDRLPGYIRSLEMAPREVPRPLAVAGMAELV